MNEYIATGTLFRAKAVLAFLLFFLGLSAHAEQDMIELRSQDEVYFRDGNIMRGFIYETDTKDQLKIKSITNTVRMFDMSEVREIRRRATADTELTRLGNLYAGKPDMVLRIAKEAMRRFDNVTPKVITMLEKEAGSKDVELLSFLCELYLQNEKPGLALKVADTLVERAGSRARTFVLHGRALLACDQPEPAAKDLERAFKMAPEEEEVLVARATFLMQSGHADDARQMFAGALSKNPKNVAALVGKGMSNLRQGEFKEAEQSFQDALAVNDENRQARLGLAATLFMKGDYDGTCVESERVLRRDSKSAQAYELQAMAKLMQGNYADFEKNIEESFKEKADQPRLLLAYAAGLEREALTDDASPKDVKDTAAPKDDASAGDKKKADDTVSAKVKLDQAKAKYSELLQSTASDAYIQFFIGERKFKNNDVAGADAAFQRTIKLAPSYAPAYAAAGAVALKLGKWEAARDAYEHAIKLDPDSAEYFGGEGLALLKVQRLDEAAAAFRKALELDSHCVTALCGMGWLANRNKNRNSALDFFQKALCADGSYGYAADALKKMYVQDNLQLDYINYDDNTLPQGWRSFGPGTIKPTVENGHLAFKGTQGSATGSRVEAYREVKVDDFVRIEADFQIDPESPVTFGLRLGSTTGSGGSFELELGKDESHEIKVRFKDYAGQPQEWKSLAKPGKDWPAGGKVRLGIDTDDLKQGKMRLWVNDKYAELTLVLQKPTRVTAGFFVIVPAKETVNASIDNVVVVTRGTNFGNDGHDGPDTLIMIKEDNKNAPKKPDEPAKEPDKSPKPAPDKP